MSSVLAGNQPAQGRRFIPPVPLARTIRAMREELSLEHIETAARVIDPTFLDSPQFVDSQLAAALGRQVLVKVETTNPLGSFKGRGADFLVRDLESKLSLVCATAGNFGQGIAYAGRRHGLLVHVFVPASVTPSKLSRMRALDANVTVIEGDEADTKQAARRYAEQHADCLFVEDGQDPRIAEGAGTIGVELLAAGPIDTLVVQVGGGALITGIARWIKAQSPRTRVVGVGPSGSPAMALSWEAGRPVSTSRADTIAGALAVRDPVADSVARMRGLVDDFVLVDDADIIEAVRSVADTLGLLLEPAGAAGVAAIRRHDIPGERLAAILTGHGLQPQLVREVWGRASEAPGRAES
jgi:threonine dehydratase